MSELTLVTDFFDIGRGEDKNSELRRTTSKYMEEFRRWARIRNHLIVYTDPSSAVEIRRIRQEYALGDKTTIIEITDLFGLEPELFSKMESIAKNKAFLNFRYLPEASSNNPKYNYLWMMKYYFMNDAYQRGLLNEDVAWVDFGFDHGGIVYYDENDYDFTWEYDFGGKIHIFCLNDPDTVSCVTTLQYQQDCVMGCMYGLAREMVPVFWKTVREAMEALLMIECVDDDQELVLMAYKKYPEYFTVHVTGWQMALKECGATHMKVRGASPIQEENKIKRAIRLTVRKIIPNRNDPARRYATVCYAEAKRLHGR